MVAFKNWVQILAAKTRMDGGYSWIACVVGFLIQCIIAGQNNCSGIIFAALLDEYSINRGETGKKSFNYLSGFQSFFTCPVFLREVSRVVI